MAENGRFFLVAQRLCRLRQVGALFDHRPTPVAPSEVKPPHRHRLLFTSAMLRALILQLVSQLKEEDTNLSRLHQSQCGAAPADQVLMDCLHQLLCNFEHVYIILDALDESPRHKHREDLLQAFEDMRHWPDPQLHLLVTSRDEQDIREHLNPRPDQVVKMNNVSIEADIAFFVSSHLRDNRRLRKWEKHRDLIERTLTEGAKGVYVTPTDRANEGRLTLPGSVGSNASFPHWRPAREAKLDWRLFSRHCPEPSTRRTSACC